MSDIQPVAVSYRVLVAQTAQAADRPLHGTARSHESASISVYISEVLLMAIDVLRGGVAPKSYASVRTVCFDLLRSQRQEESGISKSTFEKSTFTFGNFEK